MCGTHNRQRVSAQMPTDLAKDITKPSGQHSLAKHLDGGRVMLRAQVTTVNAFDLRLPQQARTERRLHERASVDLPIKCRVDFDRVELGGVEGQLASFLKLGGIKSARPSFVNPSAGAHEHSLHGEK